MPRAVGLDIGSHAVRAAELNLGRPAELIGFGQVGLPRGAVEHGEVIDPGAVAASIRRLWKEAHLRDRRVRLGLASLRTIIRQVEMPAMQEDELRGALEFQAGEFIPLPPEETLLDFQVLERFDAPDGDAMMRVLIAAVHRDTLQTAVTAVREAGLQTVAVDLAPFGLIRALAVPAAAEPDETGGSAEVIVSVGSGVTIVVVHEDGLVRFVRMVDMGGDDFTAAVQQVLELGYEEAEALKRQLGTALERRDEATSAIEPPLAALVNEIRGSVDFYTAQAGARPLRRALLTGGGMLLEGFDARIADALGVPVEPADVFQSVRLGDIGFPPEQLPGLRPYLAVPVGVALGAERGALYRINLLSEREHRALSPARVALAGAGAAAVLVGVLGLATMQRNDQLARTRDELEAQQSTNQQIQGEIGDLQGARDLQAEADQARALLASVLQSEVSWSRILQEVGRVIPGDVWLDGLQGTSTTPTEEGEGDVTAGLGSVTFGAVGTDFPAAAAWLQRIATLPSFNLPWVSQVTAGEVSVGSFSVDGVTFSASAQLTEAARSERSRRAATEAGAAATPPAEEPPQ